MDPHFPGEERLDLEVEPPFFIFLPRNFKPIEV